MAGEDRSGNWALPLLLKASDHSVVSHGLTIRSGGGSMQMATAGVARTSSRPFARSGLRFRRPMSKSQLSKDVVEFAVGGLVDDLDEKYRAKGRLAEYQWRETPRPPGHSWHCSHGSPRFRSAKVWQ
jgi:hypothetical protein